MPGESKTEKATPKKRKDERKEGHVPISKDIVTIASLLGMFFILKLAFPYLIGTMQRFMERYVDMAISQERGLDGMLILKDVLGALAKTILPILLVAVALAIVATGSQTRFLFTWKNLKPKFSRLSPIKGIKNIFAMRSLVELVKNIIKITILFVILYQMIKGDLAAVARTIDMNVANSVAYTLSAVMDMVVKVALVFMAISLFDLLYQRWDYEKQIKMSKQELKEEYKQTEGDPQIKGKIKEIQRQRARSRMMQAVPEADVIIKNPTRYAVALRYQIDKDNAPVLVAKGQDELALRIIKTGEDHGVWVMENPPLARGIYASTRLGQEIPEEYYGMVAEILVYVFKLNNKTVT